MEVPGASTNTRFPAFVVTSGCNHDLQLVAFCMHGPCVPPALPSLPRDKNGPDLATSMLRVSAQILAHALGSCSDTGLRDSRNNKVACRTRQQVSPDALLRIKGSLDRHMARRMALFTSRLFSSFSSESLRGTPLTSSCPRTPAIEHGCSLRTYAAKSAKSKSASKNMVGVSCTQRH